MSNEYFLTQFIYQINDPESVSYVAAGLDTEDRPQHVRPNCNATPVA